MQSALLYPIYDTYVEDPQKWFESTLYAYGQKDDNGQTDEDERKYTEKRKNILSIMRLFQERI